MAIDMDMVNDVLRAYGRGEISELPEPITRKRPRFDITLIVPVWDFNWAGDDEAPRTGGGDGMITPGVSDRATDGQVNWINTLLTEVPEAIAAEYADTDLSKLSKKNASKLIDKLKLHVVRRPTEGQVTFLRSLAAERDVNGELVKLVEDTLTNPKTNTFELVSTTITALRKMPIPVKAAAAVPADDEFMTLAAELADMGGQHGARFAVDTEDGASNKLAFWVVKRRGTRIYLNQYIGGSGSVRVRMSRPAQLAVIKKIHAAGAYEAMIRFGHELGMCGRCGIELTDDESRAAGIGPVCINK
jgi:uncharacterized protein DUF6011